jgi:hypothetical protein
VGHVDVNSDIAIEEKEMLKPNLVLHCGGHEVERTALEGIVLPPATDTYFPVGHSTLLDMVEDAVQDIGFRFGVQAHALSKEGQRYFGLIHLLNGCGNDEHALVLGLRNSLDKAFAAGAAFGSQVFVCDNLAFHGERTFSRKHTTHIIRDLPPLIATAMSYTKALALETEHRFDRYKEVILTDKNADHIICNLVRVGAVNTSKIENVINEWDEPSHDFGGRTAWRLFNAATETLKGTGLFRLPHRTMLLQAQLDAVCDFVPVNDASIEAALVDEAA